MGVPKEESLSDETSALIQFENNVVITLWPAGDTLIAAAPMGGVNGNDASFLKEMLEYNFAQFPETSHRMSLDKSSNDAVLFGSWGVAECSFDLFLREFIVFADHAQMWSEKVTKASSLAPSKEEVTDREEDSSAQNPIHLIGKA